MRIPLPLRLIAVIAALSPQVAWAQEPESEERVLPDFDSLIETWQAQHGAEWRYQVDEQTGHLEMLFGGGAEPAFLPQSEDDWARLAKSFLAETEAMHGIAGASLVHERSVFLPLSQIGSTDKMTVRFQQVVDGVPVVGGVVNVLMNAESGVLLSVHSTSMPRMNEVSAVPSLTGSSATSAAERFFQEQIGTLPTSVGAPELVFVRVEQSGLRQPVLAWQIDVRWDGSEAVPEAWRYWIDAKSGALAKAESQVHYFDVGGTVRANGTPGTLPDTGGNPEQQQIMRYLTVTSSAGTRTTDANGNFNYAGVTGPLTCTFTFEGSFANVTNDAGTDYSLSLGLTGTGNQVLLNPTPTEAITAQANAYKEIFALRDYVRSVTPSDAHADFQALANCNLNSTCNAFFDGGSVNFYASGGGCVNTAYSTVVVHEMGHWLNVLYGTGNGGDGMGEGNADLFAMYVYDVPVVGEDFCGNGCDIRTGLNTRQFCGDCCPGCHGGVHNDGEVWMGAAWKVRRNLNTTHGDSTGDAIADLLFMDWMNSYNQSQIKSIIETQWLTLDDNDANIGNGTPNHSEIDSAFREQGFPGHDLDAILFSNVTIQPDTQNEVGPYIINATVTANIAPPVQSVRLHYRVNGGGFIVADMAPIGGDVYQASIPGQQSPAVVEYYLQATDNNANTETFPDGAPANLIEFKVGVLTIFFFNDFEGGTNEGWTVGGAGDNATTGTWVRVNPNGTAAQPEDDNTPVPGTLCWVTGQGTPGGSVGDNDVDGGQTTLLSPVFDASNLNDPEISYWRWYSNDEGGSPSTDVFTVGISNNGGSTWTTVETVGPGGAQASGGWFEHVFDISDVIAPTANMRMRFIASDQGSGSIVEAAIDDIEGIDLGPVGGEDCNNNGVPDDEDISNGTSQDCNGNAVPDECDTAGGTSADCNSNSVPDECEADCNSNGVPDECDITGGTSDDVNGNGTPDECECIGTPYCDAAPNSVGFGALISYTGSISVGQNDVVLRVQDAPPGQFGLFYYGPTQIQIPFGNGFRCVGGGTFRLNPPQPIPGNGIALRALDLTMPPADSGPGMIQVGDNWNFQFWYRDPAAGGANFNFSDALSLTFCE